MYFYRNRFYSPTFQRFVTQDPIAFRGGPNLHEYVVDDPVDFRDSGANQLVTAIVVGAVVGGAVGAINAAAGGACGPADYLRIVDLHVKSGED